jgi:hypothetical protein
VIKKLIHSLFLLAFVVSLKAQVYNNEWINYSNKYYKFKISKTGFYRIDSLALAGSGINLTSINPKNFQVFLRGKEIPIFVKGESDNLLNGSDFIEFFAEKNDGRFDTALYKSINYLPNPYVSLFNDTILAYLTWNNSTSNKRITDIVDTTYSSSAPVPYFYSEQVWSGKSLYNYVEKYAYSTSDPGYTQEEGLGIQLKTGNSYSTALSSVNMYTAAPLPVSIRINLSGSAVDNSISGSDHHLQGVIYDASNNPVTLFDTMFKGYGYRNYILSSLSNTLGNLSNVEVRSLTSATIPSDWPNTVLHYIYYKYPHTPDLNNTGLQKMYVDDDLSSTKAFLNLTNVSAWPGNTVLFYDVTNSKRINVSYTVSGGVAKILVPNSGGVKACWIGPEAGVVNINKLTPVNSTGFFTNYGAINADSAFVIITHRNFKNEADAYGAYRQTMQGGSHDVIVAPIDELYDQFAWGIEKHPLSIRNFCRFLIDSLPSRPSYVFLIGKSVQQRNIVEVPWAWPLSLIPSIGVPPTDIMYTAGLTSSNTVVPEIPIGHLAAVTPTDVTNYLLKVQQHETPLGPMICHGANDDWRKHVLHFAGGTDVNQQNQFQGYLANYKSMIVDSAWGGRVFDFRKTTTAPIQITLSDSVKNHFSYGVGLVTFFGHGSPTGFDQAIDDPNSYNNPGKYPLFIANSCFSGNIHTHNVISVSEKFVMANQKGSIAFLAASSVGFVNTLYDYTQNIYSGLSYTKYGKGIGDIIKSACSALQSSDDLHKFTALDMTLHGDPALKIWQNVLPDYYIDNSRVSFDTKSHTDSLGMRIVIANIGRARKDSMWVRIERYFPNGDSTTIFKYIDAPYYRDTIEFNMVVDFTKGIGLNKFKVFIDAYSSIAESCETNNSTNGTVDVFIQGGDLVPVYPYRYAVIPSTNTITLKASTADPFTGIRNYRLQLDTCDAFSSPLTSTLISSSGGVVEWTVNLPFADSTVYYWRVSKDSTSPTNSFIWRESSFQTITNKHGWGQSHFFQFKNDGYQFVKWKRSLRQFVFQNDKSALFCRTGILWNIDPANIIYSINGSVKHTWNCEWNGWTIAQFDSISGKPVITNTMAVGGPTVGPWGNWLCVDKSQPLYANDFGYDNYHDPIYGGNNTHPLWKQDLEAYLNSIPTNNWVLAYSSQNHTSSTFPNSLYQEFEKFGSANIRTVADTVPYIIFGKKGATIGGANEVIGPNSLTQVELNDSIQTRWSNGFVVSENIGPAYKWNSLHWKVHSLDATPGDTTFIKIVRIKTNGTVDSVSTVFTQDSLNVMDLYNYVDAGIYPYIRLVAFKKDRAHTTSPQLKWWYVLYDEAPECAINPKKGFQAINDSLQEGDKVTFILPIENVGIIPFADSLVCTYWIEDAQHVLHTLPQKLKAKPFNPGAVLKDTIKLDTYLYPGENALWIDINPPQNSRYQKEQYHFNNIARYPFTVSRDITNPLMDVTFDGVRIMNGDIVSAKPHILVNLKDENRFLALNDTAAFKVFLKRPSDPTDIQVFFGSNELKFTPAQLPGNSCKIEYDPVLPEDGKHVLIVQAKDRSDNQSGAIDYRITFEVVNKPTITQVVNYPNPFTTSTRFVFNLTGSEVPDVFNIQIMTITGKIVKTIMRDELGPLHVGRNITEYAWDGRDDFGDRLANGVYLYKVQTKLNGQSIERKATEADSYFTKEIGKMVIMR